jgi:DNA-binding NarL/FixJ family response regulator
LGAQGLTRPSRWEIIAAAASDDASRFEWRTYRGTMESPHGEGIRVLIVASETLFRSGLRAMIEREGMHVVAETDSGEQTLELVVRLDPDVALVDVDPPDTARRELMLRIAELRPAARIVALTSGTDPDEVIDALLAGADGYLAKDASTQTLVGGILRAVVAGLPLVSGRITRALIGRLRDLHAGRAQSDAMTIALSERELEVLALIADGMDNSAIAAALFISPETVKHHVHSILAKLGVENRVQAAVVAVRAGLV